MKRETDDGSAGFKPLKVFYDGQCPLCRGMRRRYGEADCQGRLEWLDANTHMDELARLGVSEPAALGRIHVTGPDGGIQTGAAAIAAIWREMPQVRYRVLAASMRLPGAMPIAERVYGFIARRRSRRACEKP